MADDQQMIPRSHQIIPGGAHTYAKGDDQYPINAPAFIERGEGCHVWDVEGNEYIEYGMGLRAVSLGHAYPSVVAAASKQMERGNNFTRPSTLEVECAEQLLSIVKAGEMVKFAKDGSTVTTAAVRLARAATGRDVVAQCKAHPFLSYDDWFIGVTPMDRGVPDSAGKFNASFRYNDIASVEKMFADHRNEIACVILEPARTSEPKNDFLLKLQDLCRSNGALFILDEMITGFRWSLGGGQEVYGLDPDLSAFGKGMANGFSQSALVGKEKFMKLGGFSHNEERVFLLSTTHGAENHSLAAAVETMRIYKEEPIIQHLYRAGDRLRNGVQVHIDDLDLEGHFKILGRSCNMVYATRDQDKLPSQPFRTLFLQEIIKRGVIAPSFVNSYSHSDAVTDKTIDVIGQALEVYRKALDEGVEKHLVGRPVQPVFRKYSPPLSP